MINIENYLRIKQELETKKVKLIAVSKKQPFERIQYLYEQGHKVFGENQAQAILEKHEEFPADIEWHFIGHLQTNKVKYIAPFVSLIHSVDSLKLLIVINKEAIKNDRTIDCLLQIHIADEDTKFGMNEEEVMEVVTSEEFDTLLNVRVCGLMGMATFTTNEDQIREEYRYLKTLFDKLKNEKFKDNPDFTELSMGMSDDYKIAIEEGSTMIRVGTIIFGSRIY